MRAQAFHQVHTLAYQVDDTFCGTLTVGPVVEPEPVGLELIVLVLLLLFAFL